MAARAGVLQSSLGALNPDLYKSPLIPEEDTSNYPDGHLGRVWFSLNYDRQQEKLHINLVRIHNLPSRDAADPAASCDPLVRFSSKHLACVLAFFVFMTIRGQQLSTKTWPLRKKNLYSLACSVGP